MEEMKNIVAVATSVIEKGTPLLVDESQKDYFVKTTESLKTALGLVGENQEKMARMQDAAVKYANQLCFILFRTQALTDELETEFRKLPSPEATSSVVKHLNDERDARIAEINKAHEAIIDEQKDLDIFLAVIAGMSQEEAARKMAEHDAQLRG